MSTIIEQVNNNKTSINLSKLKELDLIDDTKSERQESGSWEIKFDLGSIEVEGLGSVNNCVIAVPLLGNYVAPDLTNFDQVVESFEDWVVAEDLPWPTQDAKGNGSFARTAASLVAHALPDVPIDSPEMGSFLCLNLGGWWLDDIFEVMGTSLRNTELTSAASQLNQVCEDVWTGKYASSEDIPKSLPQLDPTLVVFQYGQELAKKSIPGFVENSSWFIRRIHDTAKAAGLTMRPGYSDKVSLETYRIIRVHDAGYLPYYEFGLLVKGILPKPEVRNHMLFSLIEKLSSLACGIANDLISLPKDIERSVMDSNYVLLLAKKEHLTLEEAIKKTIKLIEEQTRDLEMALEELRNEFEDDDEVERLVETTKNVFNGQIAFYNHTGRYGQRTQCWPPSRKSK